MKFFLQDSKTRKFMRCDSMWTLDFNEAMNFLSVERAISFGMKELKSPFQIVQVETNGLSTSFTITMPKPRLVEASKIARAFQRITAANRGAKQLKPVSVRWFIKKRSTIFRLPTDVDCDVKKSPAVSN